MTTGPSGDHRCHLCGVVYSSAFTHHTCPPTLEARITELERQVAALTASGCTCGTAQCAYHARLGRGIGVFR